MVETVDPINASTIVAKKTQNKVVMLDNPPSKKAPAAGAKPAKLSNNRRKEIQQLDIPIANQRYDVLNLEPDSCHIFPWCRYDLYLPLHEIWKGYIDTLLYTTPQQ